MNMFYADTSCDTLSHNVMCEKKSRVRVFCPHLQLSADVLGQLVEVLDVDGTPRDEKLVPVQLTHLEPSFEMRLMLFNL